VIKGVPKAAVHRRRCYMGVHKVEEGSLVVREGVVFRWVVITSLVEDDYVAVELELGIGSVGGVLVRTVIGGCLRQVWRGGGEVVVEVIVEMRSGEGGGTERLALVVYIVAAVHGGGDVAFCNLCTDSGPFGWLCTGIEMMKMGGKRKKKGWRGGRRGDVI